MFSSTLTANNYVLESRWPSFISLSYCSFVWQQLLIISGAVHLHITLYSWNMYVGVDKRRMDVHQFHSDWHSPACADWKPIPEKPEFLKSETFWVVRWPYISDIRSTTKTIIRLLSATLHGIADLYMHERTLDMRYTGISTRHMLPSYANITSQSVDISVRQSLVFFLLMQKQCLCRHWMRVL